MSAVAWLEDVADVVPSDSFAFDDVSDFDTDYDPEDDYEDDDEDDWDDDWDDDDDDDDDWDDEDDEDDEVDDIADIVRPVFTTPPTRRLVVELDQPNSFEVSPGRVNRGGSY